MSNKVVEVNGVVGEGVTFERIRRITGYLVGTLDRFNDAKFAEVNDRVKHSISTGAGLMEQI
ncbi:MAG: ribonucleoside-triphosphate reductase [Clostridiales bacterium]|nr:ribonucleoside-triphosphate reductase [Clostridiales bacterium]